MVKRIGKLAVLVLWLGNMHVLWAASLTATVTNTSVIEGESIALYLEGVDLTEMPDVSALYPLFDVLDSRTSDQVSIINGVRTNKNVWRFELMAKNPGMSVIPSFTANGVATDPIAINVTARGTPGAVRRDNIFFELAVDTAEPWVQGQVVLTVSVFDGSNIASGSLSEPEVPDLQIERLPDVPQQIVEREGVEYRLITRRYAMFPQRSGEIVIPPLQLSANIRDIDTHSQRRYSQNRRVTIRSESLVLTVKPRPAESTAAWWLPVAEINLTSEWSSDIGASVVGEPLTRTLLLTALGAANTQLPEISATPVEGLKIYPDAAVLDTEALDGGLVSARQEKWSIIPQKAGKITLPEIKITWWDTTHDAERETVLPAEVIEVAAATSEMTASQAAPPLTVNTDQAGPVTPLAVGGTEDARGAAGIRPDSGGYWMWLAIIALLGWLLTVCGWWLQRRRQPVEQPVDSVVKPVTADALLQQVGKASTVGDLRKFRAALLFWAAREWPEQPPVSPAEIGRLLNDNELQAAFAKIDAAIYSDKSLSIDMPDLNSQLRKSLAQRAKPPRAIANPLPQL